MKYLMKEFCITLICSSFFLFSCNNATTPTTSAPVAGHVDSVSTTAKTELGCECAGMLQTPISIMDKDAVLAKLPPMRFVYTPNSTMYIQNVKEKHTIKVAPKDAAPNYLLFNNQQYDFVEFHFHDTSEHTINGFADSMEIHLIHQNKQTGAYVVVGILISKGNQPNAVLSTIWNNFPKPGDYTPQTLPVPVNVGGIINYTETDGYYTYVGSLTTPPYTEGLAWVVMKKRLVLTGEQIKKFQEYYKYNSHPLQKINNRIVYKNR